mgnify:FL=1
MATVLHEGFLLKRSAVLGRLDRRYFKLHRGPPLVLEYFLPPPPDGSVGLHGKRRGAFTLVAPWTTAKRGARGTNAFVLHTSTGARVRVLASSAHVAGAWLRAIGPARRAVPSPSRPSSEASSHSPLDSSSTLDDIVSDSLTQEERDEKRVRAFYASQLVTSVDVDAVIARHRGRMGALLVAIMAKHGVVALAASEGRRSGIGRESEGTTPSGWSEHSMQSRGSGSRGESSRGSSRESSRASSQASSLAGSRAGSSLDAMTAPELRAELELERALRQRAEELRGAQVSDALARSARRVAALLRIKEAEAAERDAALVALKKETADALREKDAEIEATTEVAARLAQVCVCVCVCVEE